MKNLILILISTIALISCEKEEIITPDKGMNIRVGIFDGQLIKNGLPVEERVELSLAKDIVNNYYLIKVDGVNYYPKLIEIDNSVNLNDNSFDGINLYEEGRELTFKVKVEDEFLYFKGTRQ